MSAPTVPESLESDEPTEYGGSDRDPVQSATLLLLWLRQNRFAVDNIQIGNLTLTGIVDNAPRGKPQRDDIDLSVDMSRLDPLAAEFAPDIAAELAKE